MTEASDQMDNRVRVGLVGAGPWAKQVHAPGLDDHPATELTAVWARRRSAAEDVARGRAARVCDSFDELLSQVDAVAFAIPPAVQAELALEAAKAGKHLILEKPIAPDVVAAERLADAVADNGLVSLVMLTLRYTIETREWLADLAATGGWTGGNARWLSGALLGGQYSGSPWRHEMGALADVGPHVLDLLDAALGPIVEVVGADQSADDLWQVICRHEGGASSTATLSIRLPVSPTVGDFSVYGAHGYRALARRPGGEAPESYAALLDDFAAMIETGTTSHPCDVQRGLHLQRVLDLVLSAAA